MKKNNKGEKIVYVGMCVDLIHHGHINIISEAKKLGKVVVGLLTDEAIASYKKVPLLNFEQRKQIVENIVGFIKLFPKKLWIMLEIWKKTGLIMLFTEMIGRLGYKERSEKRSFGY